LSRSQANSPSAYRMAIITFDDAPILSLVTNQMTDGIFGRDR
jgi:hypothetical protein